MSTREFDDIIKQKAQRRQAAVPPDIWENISSKKKKRRKPFFWLIFFVLFIGISVAVWKNKTGNNDIAAVATEKTKADKNNSINKSNEEVITPVDQNKNNRSSVSNKIKNNDTNEVASKTTTQDLIDLNTSNNVVIEKEKTLLTQTKKHPATNTVTENEKLFLQRQYKRNIKGKYKATVQNASAAELTGNVTPKNVIDANETKKEQLQKNSIAGSLAANNSVAEISIAATIDNNRMNAITGTIAGSFDIKKITQPGKDSIDKKETAVTTQKTNSKQKNTSLKIEARATMTFPIQQYEQPQTVQRILSTPGAAFSFASDKSITSTIENGNGFSISLVKKINNKWSIGAGISYLRFTERLQLPGNETNTEYRVVQRLREGPNGAYLKPDTLGASNTYSTTLLGRNIYHNAGIPLFVRYRFVAGKKLSCELTTGFTMNLLRKYVNNIPGQFTTVYADGSKQSGMKNSMGLDLFAGLLFSGRLYRKYEWFAASEYTYNLSAYKTSSLSFNKKIHLPGISFGVFWELKK